MKLRSSDELTNHWILIFLFFVMKAKKGILLFLLLPILFSSCRNSAEERTFPYVVALDYPSYDLARSCMGEEGSLEMLLYPGMEIHGYDLSPSDIVDMENADIFIYTGGESDHWVTSFLSQLDDIRVFSLLSESPVKLEEETEDLMDDHHHAVDEHVWMSIENEMALTGKFASLLSSVDEEKKNKYEENRDRRIGELVQVRKEIESLVDEAVRKEIVVADRFPLLYFSSEFGLSYSSAFPSCSEESEPSMKKVSELIDTVISDDIPVVFHLDMSSSMLADMIAEETGTDVGVLYAMHTVSKRDFDDGVTYIDLMERNIESLREALF